MRTNGYQSLANAIVVNAATDYRKALKKLKKKPNDEKSLILKQEVEQFFQSEWYGHLTSLDPQVIISKIKKEVDK